MEPKNFWKEMQRLCKQRGGTCDDANAGMTAHCAHCPATLIAKPWQA